MMREPWFWRDKGFAAKAASLALSPLGALYNGGQKLRWRMATPYAAAFPVICIGNASLGGVGKTPFALMLNQLLQRRSIAAHFLTRGHGGALSGPVRVDPDTHHAGDVGDEALLLAARVPCWLARNRPAGAMKAASSKTPIDALIMDDGLQNPSLEKDLSFLLIDNQDPHGNGRVFPAGPMREPLRQAAARAGAIIAVKPDRTAPLHDLIKELAQNRPLFSTWLTPDRTELPEKIIAFCGIGAPHRFFHMLEKYGRPLAGKYAFPDHHNFTGADLKHLRHEAQKHDAVLITTEKDYVRIAPDERTHIETLPVTMQCDDPDGLVALISGVMAPGVRER